MNDATAKNARLLAPILIGAVISVVLGVYGASHKGNSIVFQISGFSNLARVKSWLTVVVIFFVLVQLGSALIMYGKIRKITAPPWIATLHRWSGRIAFFVAVPIGVYCLYGVGFQHHNTRVMLHSLLGCLFFGVFTVKMLVLTKRGIAGWVLPLLGGLVFTVLVAISLTSAAWYFTSHS
ncbi:MAG TPA: hypothetical protein DGT23_32565 [Micromonosporaceae bacterium]|nr:hypothetical protein [Micromonosporaceae bacterium]